MRIEAGNFLAATHIPDLKKTVLAAERDNVAEQDESNKVYINNNSNNSSNKRPTWG